MQEKKIEIRFIGMDFWARAVFVSPDGRYFKSTEVMSHPDFGLLSPDEKEILLSCLHDTEEFDGEPGWHISREHFSLTE